MRVIAGKYRNRNLKAADHFRPTTDRVRETLFDILQTQIEGSVFVDAFAGSGAVGIEALSRGASMAYFIEPNRKALSVLEWNLEQCCLQDRWRIFSLNLPKALEVLHKEQKEVDFLFFDPPYDFQNYPDLLQAAANLYPSAMLVLESSVRTNFVVPETLHLVKERKIGETRLSFYKIA